LTSLTIFTDTSEHGEVVVLVGERMTRIAVREVTARDILAGKSDGLRDFPKLFDAVEQTPTGDTIVLDWEGVEIATASYFGATVVALLRMAMSTELNRYFIVANLNKTCLEELKLVLDFQGLVILAGEWKGGHLKKLQVLGTLEAPYITTLEAVGKLESASATELHTAQHGGAAIGKTGWINRLSHLHKLRLIRKERVGREYRFHALS
jgi:hypothetical protein